MSVVPATVRDRSAEDAMDYEEAVGVGRVISVLQRKMLLDIDSWEAGPATEWNSGELLWKKLIEPAADGLAGYRLTERGAEVVNALELQPMSEPEILAALNAADGDSERVETIMREMEYRGLLT